MVVAKNVGGGKTPKRGEKKLLKKIYFLKIRLFAETKSKMKMELPASAVVQRLTCNPKIEGSNPPPSPWHGRRENVDK
jgi:hypothetical protein